MDRKDNISIKRVDAADEDFVRLVAMLDGELVVKDGEDHDFYHQYNLINDIRYAVVIAVNDEPCACGAIKPFDANTMEVKRMFTREEYRGRGLASRLLAELESWTIELKGKRCILETGKYMPDAVAFYRKNGYEEIPNYGQYVGVDSSICFEKRIL